MGVDLRLGVSYLKQDMRGDAAKELQRFLQVTFFMRCVPRGTSIARHETRSRRGSESTASCNREDGGISPGLSTYR